MGRLIWWCLGFILFHPFFLILFFYVFLQFGRTALEHQSHINVTSDAGLMSAAVIDLLLFVQGLGFFDI